MIFWAIVDTDERSLALEKVGTGPLQVVITPSGHMSLQVASPELSPFCSEYHSFDKSSDKACVTQVQRAHLDIGDSIEVDYDARDNVGACSSVGMLEQRGSFVSSDRLSTCEFSDLGLSNDLRESQ